MLNHLPQSLPFKQDPTITFCVCVCANLECCPEGEASEQISPETTLIHCTFHLNCVLVHA